MSGAEFKLCSAGCFDVGELNHRGTATAEDFSFEEFLKRKTEWEQPAPRPAPKYDISYDIQSDDVTGEFSEFSVNKVIGGRKNRNLQESIREYILSVDSMKHMFCIYSNTDPHKLYTRTVMEVAGKMFSKARKWFPVVLIVTNCDRVTSNACRSLDDVKRSQKHLSRIWFRNLTNNLPDGPRLLETNVKRQATDIAVGSATHILSYIAKLKSDREDEMLKLSVKHVVVVGAESLAADKAFYDTFREIAFAFKFSPTNFIFLHHYSEASCTPLLSQKTCASLVRGSMYIEVEKQGAQEIFDRVQFLPVVSTAEFVDELVAEDIEAGGNHEGMFDAARRVMTPPAQKLSYCVGLIDKLRHERQKSNQEGRRERKERILIVAKDSSTAILLIMFLKQRTQESRLQKYDVKGLLVSGTYEAVEDRNFEFRWGTLEVLVIDWQSIRSVNRGTVDAVIFHDPPPKKYFQTIMESEVQRLVSRNCVKIKLYILFDQEEDILLLVKYAKFLSKYNKAAPQWFVALYKKYCSRWYEKREQKLLGQKSSDEEDWFSAEETI